MPGRSVRVAELLCVLSLCSDLGMGQPMDHGFRACLLATRLADAMGLEPAVRNDVYQLALLRWVGCTAHAHELSVWFEDEIAAHRRLFELDTASLPQMAGDLLRYAGAGRSPLARARALGGALGTAARRVPEMFRASCEVAEGLCPPLAVPSTVAVGLRFVFERWDGGGVPGGSSRPALGWRRAVAGARKAASAVDSARSLPICAGTVHFPHPACSGVCSARAPGEVARALHSGYGPPPPSTRGAPPSL